MDIPAIERALAASAARPILTDARLVRRVIKRDRHLPGVGLQVPHARCYAIRKEALLAIVDPRELGRSAADLPDDVLLLPRPERAGANGKPLPELLGELWRYAFHARVHQEIAQLAAAGKITPARLRERIHRIGQTEFDEIRDVLRADRLLLAPDDDLETYAEFAAVYLELSSFAPALLGEVFPTLANPAAANAALAEDVDTPRLLELTRPAGATRLRGEDVRISIVGKRVPATAPEEGREADEAPGAAPVTGAEAGELRAEAQAAREQGNNVRAALLCVRAGAMKEARADAEALARRLDRALRPVEAKAKGAEVDGGAEANVEGAAALDVAAWTGSLLALAEHTVAHGDLFRQVEARLLYDVQSACLEGERPIGKVDVVEWALSLGRRPLARLLPATREIRVAHQLERAAKKVPRVGLADDDRGHLRELCGEARHRADLALRDDLRPRVRRALVDVGFRPTNVPERVALEKVVEELLDQASAHGHLNLGQLRDAISRNAIKMRDLAGLGELWRDDALLAADRRLGADLDGVHRRGEIYLRGLQKGSSLLFGTRIGRALVRYVLLPVGGGFLVPFATPLIINELAEIGRAVHLLPQEPPELHHHHHHLELPGAAWVIACTVVLFGLIHSAAVRALVLQGLRAVGYALATIFLHVPRWIFSRPAVQRLLKSGPVLALWRFAGKPGLVTAALCFATPIHRQPPVVALPAAGVLFVALGALLNLRVGMVAEEVALDALARWFGALRQQVLPGLFRLIAGFFRSITDAIDRGIYTVDEWLRFRRGQGQGALALKGALGLLWFAVAYFLRILVNLFIEPTVNPLKHFPTVTVAAKVMWATVGPALHGALEPLLGRLRAGTITGFSMALLPGFFGFLVWELKENYKLYGASRPATLRPVMIGHHGETMGALLKPGLHSGTLPKLWTRLRRAARDGDGSVEKHREALRELEEAVERFVERELCALLADSEHFPGAVRVSRVALASNRVHVELSRVQGPAEGAPEAGGEAAFAVAFEEQSGWLCAGVVTLGWAGTLTEDERLLFEDALGGLYHRAAVDLVREQIEAALPPGTTYDVADEGLVVWLPGFATEILYDLHSGPALHATVRGEPLPAPPPPIAREALLFGEQGIAWTEWVAAWSETPRQGVRVVRGASLLPRPADPGART